MPITQPPTPTMAHPTTPAPRPATTSTPEVAQSKRDLTSWWRTFKRGNAAKLYEEKGMPSWSSPSPILRPFLGSAPIDHAALLTPTCHRRPAGYLWSPAPTEHQIRQRRHLPVQR